MAPAIVAHGPIDGAERVRRLWASDVGAYRAHLLRLEPQARYSRFGTVMSDAVVAEHAALCFGADTLVFGCFVDGLIRAGAELHLLLARGLRSGAAEAAFSVEKPWRHAGLGSALIARLILAARNRGLNMLTISCLPQNFAMQTLAKKFDAALTFETDEVTGKIKVQWPTPQTLLTECVEDSLDFASALFDLQKQILAAPARRAA